MLDRLRRNRGQRTPEPDRDGEVFLVVGLGNPGRKYQSTRHNAGFMVIDQMYNRLPPGSARTRFQSEYVETSHQGRRIVLAKPQTFMNESGIAVVQIARWFNVPRDHILIVHDELDLPFGTIRLRPGGSDGGHNGVASVTSHLKSQDIPRLRVGIGRPGSGATVPYVLSSFFEDERAVLPAVIDRAADAAFSWIENGMTAAMNEHNRRVVASSGRSPTGS
jgi:peptidyl-tRNA hydrolase, PTH1 family